VRAVRVVETLNICKDTTLGGLARRIALMKDFLKLELGKETLPLCIVVPVAHARPADLDLILSQPTLILCNGVLAAAVGVIEQLIG
jgi:hypothetical protein